jgi:excisionase family DNA binding protein
VHGRAVRELPVRLNSGVGTADESDVTEWQPLVIDGSDSEPTPAPTRGYLRAAEAAALLRVSPKTISRWAREGKLGHVVTLGGHRRFRRADIEALADRLVVLDTGVDGRTR